MHPNRNLVDECDLDYLNFCLGDDVVRAEGCGSLYRQVENGWCKLDSTTSVCCALSESDCCELNVMLVAVAAVAVVLLVVACIFGCCCRSRLRSKQAQASTESKQEVVQDSATGDGRETTRTSNPFWSYHKPENSGAAAAALSHSSDLRDEYRMDDSTMVKKGILPPRGKSGYSV